MPDAHDSPATSPFVMERLLRDAYRREKREEWANADDGVPAGAAVPADDPVETAQELAYQAYESDDADAARALVERALGHDPACVDALTIRAFLESEDAGTLIEALEQALAVGEEVLGEEFFAEHMGGFWPLVQARPYLRAVKQLAEVLWNVGRRFDAVAQYESLLDLDPEDNMGNMALLLGYYLAMGEVQRAWDLLEEHQDEDNTVCAWSWVLLFLQTGDEEAALDALRHAVGLNAHVAPLLVGLADVPDAELPAFFVAGSREEAVSTLEIVGEGFSRVSEVQLWLYNALIAVGAIDPEPDDDAPGAARVGL
ncbi:hypothetical protein KDM41_02200 [bacterium]|nr:hypothetical protein [bacterium]